MRRNQKISKRSAKIFTRSWFFESDPSAMSSARFCSLPSLCLYLSLSVALIVIYSTIYLMFIESCFYWSSTVIHWGVCFLFNPWILLFSRSARNQRTQSNSLIISSGLLFEKPKDILPFFASSRSSFVVEIKNIANNLQFSELELVSDHTHRGDGRAGRRSHGFG